MDIREANRAQTCCNVMEALVTQEIQQQMLTFQPQLVKHINKVEVMTYALNRLPALYASSEKGLQHQTARAKNEFGKQITLVVRQALAGVMRDPFRVAAPLKPQEKVEAQAALEKLKGLLHNEQLTWSNLVSVVEQTLLKTEQGEMTWKSKRHILH